MRAQIRVSVPFWPILASSWNQISSGLSRALAGSVRESQDQPKKYKLLDLDFLADAETFFG